MGDAHGRLGSVDEAEDVVQDAWLRLRRPEAVVVFTVEHGLITSIDMIMHPGEIAWVGTNEEERS